MPRDFLKGAKDQYDVIVIGSGLAGLTAANVLARAGYSVLLLEQHYKLGGMATWASGGTVAGAATVGDSGSDSAWKSSKPSMSWEERTV